jgi:hypothetical protein
LNILKEFQKLHEKGSHVEVKWLYHPDDDDVFEAGEDYKAIIEIPFEMVKLDC